LRAALRVKAASSRTPNALAHRWITMNPTL
jgi:hypothetical protein